MKKIKWEILLLETCNCFWFVLKIKLFNLIMIVRYLLYIVYSIIYDYTNVYLVSIFLNKGYIIMLEKKLIKIIYIWVV